MQKIELRENKLYIDDEMVPISIDIGTNLYSENNKYSVILNDCLLEKFTKSDNRIGLHYFDVKKFDIPEYNHIFTIIVDDIVNHISLELAQDMMCLHNLSFQDIMPLYIKFNLETEEGRYTYGLVEKTIKNLRVQLRLNDIEKDFIS